MNCTQNEKISQVTEETLVIGIDIALLFTAYFSHK